MTVAAARREMMLVTDRPGEPPVAWQWMHKQNKLPWSSDLRVIALARENGSIAAAVGFNGWQDQSCWMHVAFDTPHSLTRALLWAAFQYPFVTCGKEAVYAQIDKANAECLRLVEKLGYRKIAETVDCILFEMKAGDCRWIKGK